MWPLENFKFHLLLPCFYWLALEYIVGINKYWLNKGKHFVYSNCF